LIVTALPAQQATPDAEPFLRWARANATPIATATPGPDVRDLAGLKPIVGEARVVGVGESIHAIREFLGLRQRVAQYLIEELDFSAVALESGLPDSKMVYDYVLGAPMPPRMWEDGITWTMGSFEGTRELIDWMRAWNLDPKHTRKIRFYGLDVAGANGSWVPALNQVLAYLDRVEPEYAAIARPRLVPLVEKFARPSFNEANKAYSSLPEADRRALAAYVAELADRIASLRHFYVARSAIEDYEWASAIAENLRGANAMLVNFEARNRPNPVWNARDRMMAENVRWIRSREAGVVVLAHNAHVQRAKSVQVLPSQAVQGMFLASMFGDGYKSIGFTFNQGTMAGKPGGELTLPLADSTSIDGVLARVGKPLFLLDLQKVPPGPAREWLNRPVKQRIQNVVTEYNQLESWNAVIFVDSIAPTRFP
jgi:erythromycin esterase